MPTKPFGDTLRVLPVGRADDGLAELSRFPPRAPAREAARSRTTWSSIAAADRGDRRAAARRSVDEVLLVVRLGSSNLVQLQRLGDLLEQNAIAPRASWWWARARARGQLLRLARGRGSATIWSPAPSRARGRSARPRSKWSQQRRSRCEASRPGYCARVAARPPRRGQPAARHPAGARAHLRRHHVREPHGGGLSVRRPQLPRHRGAQRRAAVGLEAAGSARRRVVARGDRHESPIQAGSCYSRPDLPPGRIPRLGGDERRLGGCPGGDPRLLLRYGPSAMLFLTCLPRCAGASRRCGCAVRSCSGR